MPRRVVMLVIMVLVMATAVQATVFANVRIRLVRLGWEEVAIVNCTIPGQEPHSEVLPDGNWRVWCDYSVDVVDEAGK